MAYADSMEKLLIEVHQQKDTQDARLANYLRANGWTRSCDYPGSYWLWEKTFPPSHIQKRRQRDGSFEPWPGKHVAGVSQDVAARMEASWQQQYDDTRQFQPTEAEYKEMECEG